MKLETDTLMEIHGGASSLYKYGLGILFGGIMFAASVIYGFIYPEKC